MKFKMAQIFLELIVIGGGAVLTKIIDTAFWVGIVVIAVGVLGLVFTLAGRQIMELIPIRIVIRKRTIKDPVNGNKEKYIKISWLDGLILQQTNCPQKYINIRLHRIFVSNPSELGIEMEIYNGSVFGLEFKTIHGEVAINNVSLGHLLTSRGNYSCSPGSYSLFTFDIRVDASVIKTVQDADANKTGIKCGLLLNWDVSPEKVAEPYLKPFLMQFSENNNIVVPQQN